MNVRVPVVAAGLLAVGSSGLAATLGISDEVSHALSSDVFGQFLERPSWGGERGPEGVCDDQGKLSPEIEKYLADLRAPVVRFPFGTDGDYVDWQDLIDLPGRAERPAPQRTSMGILLASHAGAHACVAEPYPLLITPGRLGEPCLTMLNVADGSTMARNTAVECRGYNLQLSEMRTWHSRTSPNARLLGKIHPSFGTQASPAEELSS